MKKQQKIMNFILYLITICLIITFSIVTCINFIGTTHISYTYNAFKEYAYFSMDNVLITALGLIVVFAIIFLINKLFKLDSIPTKKLQIIITLYIIILGIIWVISMNTYPVNDQSIVITYAKALSNGDYSSFAKGEYLYKYTHQLGITYIFQIFYKIFGENMNTAIMICNVLCIAGIYNILYKIMLRITESKKAHNIYWIISALCLAPVFYCVFLYGTIIGLFFAVLGILLLIKFYETNDYKIFALAFISMGLSVIAKSNYKIYIIAAVLVLLFTAIKEKRYLYILLSGIICISAFSPALVQNYYESVSKIDLGKGLPGSLWIAMGLQDGNKDDSCGANGWYNAYSVKVYMAADSDYNLSNKVGKKYISDRALEFAGNPAKAVTFFTNKIQTQWSEPTFQTFWMVMSWNNHNEQPKWISSISEKSDNTLIYDFMKFYLLLVYIGNLIFFICRFKKLNIWQLYLGIIIVGGFVLSFIWEAKSLYQMPYFMLSLVFAASGITTICEWLERFLNNKKNKETASKN